MRREPHGSCNVRQAVDQPLDGVLVAFDRGTLMLGERDLDEHSLQTVLRFEELRLAGSLGEIEVTPGAGHPVWALLEEGVGAVAVPEVVILKRVAGAGGAGRDRVAVEENLDRAHVAREVPGVGIGLGEGDRGDPRVVRGGVRR